MKQRKIWEREDITQVEEHSRIGLLPQMIDQDLELTFKAKSSFFEQVKNDQVNFLQMMT